MSELDEFTAQLNAAGNSNQGGQQQPGAGAPGGNQGPNAQQLAAMKAAEEMRKQMEARPLTHDELKGKVDVKWYGHAGFKIHFLDKDNEHRNIYVDIWIDNKDCPEEEKAVCPNDCDLALVSHG